MKNYSALLEPVQMIQVDKNKFAITCNDKIYFVSSLMFDLFTSLKNGLDLSVSLKNIAVKYENVPDETQLEKIVEENIQRFLAEKTPEQKKASSYINFQKKLFSKEFLSTFTKYTAILFNKYVFLILFSASTYWSFLLLKSIYMRGTLFDSNIAWHNGIGLVLLSYLFLLAIAIIHEIGHASASHKYGIKAKEIGFGFYLFFPVLYTNVSEIWLLKKYKRILVNIGGIYFQLIINGLLLFLYKSDISNNLVCSLFVTNSILILYSLNPFMRNDGYWIYSDLFDIPNLAATAFDYPLRFIQLLRGKIKNFHPNHINTRIQKIALFAYSILMYVLILMLPIGLLRMTLHNYELAKTFLTTQNKLSGILYYEGLFKMAKTTMIYCLIAFFTYRMFKMIIKKYKTI
jgi:putative peptide zinc metalloprotease protein